MTKHKSHVVKYIFAVSMETYQMEPERWPENSELAGTKILTPLLSSGQENSEFHIIQ